MASGADKGFFGSRVGYWRLSYRGRFLYDLLMGSIGAALVATFVWWWYAPTAIAGYWFVGVLVLVCVASAAYNYSRWQTEVRGITPDAEPGAAADPSRKAGSGR